MNVNRRTSGSVGNFGNVGNVGSVGSVGSVGNTVGSLLGEDVVVLASATPWRVPWELMMSGPFVSCGLLDGEVIRHVTVPAMVASAVRRRTAADEPLEPCDYSSMPVFDPGMPLLDAAVLVAETGWDLAVVMDPEPRVITARSVYRALFASTAAPDARGPRSGPPIPVPAAPTVGPVQPS